MECFISNKLILKMFDYFSCEVVIVILFPLHYGTESNYFYNLYVFIDRIYIYMKLNLYSSKIFGTKELIEKRNEKILLPVYDWSDLLKLR